MRRLPILPTLIVALAVATMIALGVWQLERRQEKAVALATLATNIARAPIAFPAAGTGDSFLFRRATIDCRSIDGVSRQSGRTAEGRPGWRVVATCRTPAGPVPVQLGVAAEPQGTPPQAAGRIAGYISHAPDSRPIIAGLFDHSAKRLMLIAATPAPGLAANPGPDLSAVPNNHLAYAVQWFLFAAIAAVIYGLALRRRGHRAG
ncbi:SURF1 family protein [Sphingomonas sp. RS2018]